MNTDPLCPQQHTHPKHNPNRCIFCEYGAAVREDEQARLPENGGDTSWYLLGQRKGYASALAACAAWLRDSQHHPSKEAAAWAHAYAEAIEALGGER